MYKDFEKRNFPICFPEISDEPFDLSFQELYPIGGVFKWEEKANLMPNSLTFTPDEMIIYSKGPNSRGKSECFRTCHFLTFLANSWFPLPAKHVVTWVVPDSKFLLFQGSQHSGSQLENAHRHVVSELENLIPWSNLVLDEVWDATNSPTAVEMFKRYLEPLRGKMNCRIFVTCHQDALDHIVKENWWVFLTPRPGVSWIKQYEMVRNEWKVSYWAKETLNRLWITSEAIERVLWKELRTSPKRKKPDERNMHEFRDGDDEIPF